MTTVTNATVVAQPYATRASARPQVLDNGWVVTANYLNNAYYLQVDKNDGNGFVPLCFVVDTTNLKEFFTMASKGNTLYFIGAYVTHAYYWIIDVPTQMNVNIFSNFKMIYPERHSVYGDVDVIRDGDTLHFAETVMTPQYSSSRNIRYAKAVINSDTSLTWGPIEQASTVNNYYNQNANLVVSIAVDKSGIPMIAVQARSNFIYGPTITTGDEYMINVYRRDTTLSNTWEAMPANWSARTVYKGDASSLEQKAPSMIYVPQSVNGLVNGRFWVAWFGYDNANPTASNLWVAYSDDNGKTWTVSKLTTGTGNNVENPSMTFNSKNEVFVVFPRVLYDSVSYFKHSNNAWGTLQTIQGNNGTTQGRSYPSTALTTALDIVVPYTVFLNNRNSKVALFGSWITVEISVAPGHLGVKTDRANLLTYAITTDGTMSTITEKLNGVVIGTKTAAKGASQVLGLTAAQWDALRFGRYKELTGAENTLSVEMGKYVFTYTFDKRPATDADVLTALKALKDTQEINLPAAKGKLAAVVRSMGIPAEDTDTLDKLRESLTGIRPVYTGNTLITVAGNALNTITYTVPITAPASAKTIVIKIPGLRTGQGPSVVSIEAGAIKNFLANESSYSEYRHTINSYTATQVNITSRVFNGNSIYLTPGTYMVEYTAY